MSFRFSGAGPGVHTRDGCSVALYRRLPYLGDLEEHRSLFAPGTEVLELGCGAGRMTRRLIEWGARVTAVDNSSEMLAALPEDAAAVLGDIETLNLERRFDVALLASNLINHPAAETRCAFIDAARRHLRRRGRLLLECYDATWLREVQAGVTGRAGDISIYVERVTRDADAVAMTLRYEVDGQRWWHSSAVVPLTEADIEALLTPAGFGSFAWSGGNRWLSALAH